MPLEYRYLTIVMDLRTDQSPEVREMDALSIELSPSNRSIGPEKRD